MLKQFIAQPEKSEHVNNDKKWCREIRLYGVLQYNRNRLLDGVADKLCRIAAKECRRRNGAGSCSPIIVANQVTGNAYTRNTMLNMTSSVR